MSTWDDQEMTGVYNFTVVDTTPGERCAFAPPLGWSGGEVEYMTLLRQRYKLDPGYRQHFFIYHLNYRSGLIEAFEGPFAKQAEQALMRMFRIQGKREQNND